MSRRASLLLGIFAVVLVLQPIRFPTPTHAASPETNDSIASARPTVPIRSGSPAASRPRSSSRPITERQVVYRVVDGVTLGMNVFLPRSRGPRPAVVMVHGGAWKGGNKDELTGFGVVTPLVRAGFVVFAPNYRLAPRYRFPAGLLDVLAAIRWVRINARKLGVDPSRIGLWGGSAGGNLVTMVATSHRGARWVSAVVSWSGIYDLPLLVTHPDRDYHYWVRGYLSCMPVDCPVEAADASPVTHVGPGDPPMLLFSSRLEGTGCMSPDGHLCRRPRYHGVPDDQAKEMAKALRANGDAETLVLLPGQGHSTDYADRAMRRTIAFFKSLLARTVALPKTEPSMRSRRTA